MANSAYSFAGISGFSGFSGISGTNQTLVTFTANNTFTAGQAIYRASGSFALAQANSINTSDILGVVQSATSTQFTIVANGYITGLTGLVDGSQYYLSDITPGLITTTVPTAAGSVIKPILIAIGTTAGIVVEYPGALIGNTNTGTSGYYAKWTGTTTIGNSIVQDNGTQVTIGGNVGIGVTPSAWSLGKAIEIGFAGNSVYSATSGQINITQNAYYNSGYKYGSTAVASNYTQISGQHQWFTAPSGTAGNAITYTQAMTLDASGNLGIGTSSPAYTLDLSGSARITTSLGVGTTPSSATGEIRATGNITAYYSDDRLKTKLGVIENALDKICSLEGFYYEANETAQALGYEPVREVGISAQATQKVLPEIVAPAPIDEKYLTVRYERLAPLLIEAIKELREENKLLREEIKTLK